MNDGLPQNYDAWRLDTPPHYDDDTEVYEADLETYYHHDEKVLYEFEKKVQELAEYYGLTTDMDKAYENAK